MGFDWKQASESTQAALMPEGYHKAKVVKVVMGKKDGTLFVYYGCADQTIGVATCDFAELVDHVRRHPV